MRFLSFQSRLETFTPHIITPQTFMPQTFTLLAVMQQTFKLQTIMPHTHMSQTITQEDTGDDGAGDVDGLSGED